MIVSTDEIREIDRYAIEVLGIPSLELMERAAQHVTDTVLSLLDHQKGSSVVVICGSGNNGGDGFACARQLLDAGMTVHTILIGTEKRMTPDARTNMYRLQEAGGKITSYDPGICREIMIPACACLVDAIFGVGLSRNVEGLYRNVIHQINQIQTPIISVDVPSGLNGDTGEVMGEAVRALKTITFSACKPGLIVGEGLEYAGVVSTVSIGIPLDQMETYLRKETGNAG